MVGVEVQSPGYLKQGLKGNSEAARGEPALDLTTYMLWAKIQQSDNMGLWVIFLFIYWFLNGFT